MTNDREGTITLPITNAVTKIFMISCFSLIAISEPNRSKEEINYICIPKRQQEKPIYVSVFIWLGWKPKSFVFGDGGVFNCPNVALLEISVIFHSWFVTADK